MTVDYTSFEEYEFPYVSEVVMARERLIYNTTEDILLAMQDMGMTQTDLAKKMGKSKSSICQILDGSRNLTLRTLSDITHALGAEVRLSIIKDGRDVSHQIVPERENYKTTQNDIKESQHKLIRIVITPMPMELTPYVA